MTALPQSAIGATPLPLWRRPWASLLVLFLLFSTLGPYDVEYRATHDDDTATLATVVNGTGATIESGQTSRRIGVIALGLFALMLLAGVRRREQRAGAPALVINRTIGVPIAAFIALAVCSTLWSGDMELAARRVFVFLVLCLAAWAVARAWSFTNLLWFVTLAATATLVASVGIEILHGTFHPFDGGYRLSGLTHPNNHAKDASLAIAGILGLRRAGEINRQRCFIALVVVASLLLLTRSRTGMLSIAAAVAVTAMVTAAPRRLLGAVTLAGIAVIVFTVFAPDVIDDVRQALLLGRSAETAAVTTLTGRTQLWHALLGYAEARPVLGYGFEAFWTSNRMINVSLDQGWVVPHAHSGYIETLLELGVVGLVLLVGIIATGIRTAARRLTAHGHSAEAAFALTMLVWTAVTMVTEVALPETQYAAFATMIVLARMVAGLPNRRASLA